MAFDKTLLVNLSEEEINRVNRLVEDGINIPPQPRVLEELVRHLTRGTSDVRVLGKVISQDPGIAAMLFKVVDSPVFRKHHPFRSIEHILQTVGLLQTANLVRTISLASALPAKHNQKAFEAFWSRSHAISQLAMLIAEQRITVCNIFPDQACLAGIFHDCGVPVLMQRFPTYCTSMHLDEPGCWTDLREEDARFNADHCVVGYLVGRHWKLPDFICDAIRFHHDMTRLDDHVARTMVAILQLAIHGYYQVQRIDNNPEWDEISADVLDELGINAEALPEFMDIVLELYHRAA
ncbi:MAG: HDOD domain-containing protein [Betaproteobacteria bacterium]|nr:HDOD domain-containing protein [Betaproteobacteria bacterium]